MSFFAIDSGRKSNKELLLKYIGNLEGWHNGETFPEILKREHNRSNRTGLPTSYVDIDTGKYFQDHAETSVSEKDARDFMKKLITVLSENTRDFDVKHLITAERIGVLLVDTDCEGARAFVDKISRIFYTYFESVNKPLYLEMIGAAVLSVYLPQQINDLFNLDATPRITQTVRLSNSVGDNLSRPLLREETTVTDFPPANHWMLCGPGMIAAALHFPAGNERFSENSLVEWFVIVVMLPLLTLFLRAENRPLCSPDYFIKKEMQGAANVLIINLLRWLKTISHPVRSNGMTD